MKREIHITNVPNTKAIITESRIAEITPIARVVLIKPPKEPSDSAAS